MQLTVKSMSEGNWRDTGPLSLPFGEHLNPVYVGGDETPKGLCADL